MRSIASGKLCRAVLCSRGRRKAPARATGSPPSASRSRDRCTASPPGDYAALHSAPGGGARRLPGLQVYRHLPSRSPDRCAASPPGDYAALYSAPGAAQSACPGYRFTAICHPVARTDAQHRLREIMLHCTLLPGAAQSACPGYRFTAICHPVARTDAQHRLREIMPRCTLLPGYSCNQISGVFLKPISISIGSCCDPAGSK
ncbi:hypothetical protein AI2623V1_2270 [Klebsiella oxytoca]|nr:hypothetical protein AI2623V1_2270 [Klebsiella oxytoca]CAH5069628.1 hypothetical protein AI2623V1_2270 [Klebsiella oxytoca]